MYKYLGVLVTIISVLIFSIPNAYAADAYANSIFNQSIIGVSDSDKMLGAPDSQTGVIAGVDVLATLDMGSGEEGTGDLRIYFGAVSAGGWMEVSFLDSEGSYIKVYYITFPTSMGATTRTLAFDPDNYSGAHYRYIRLRSIAAVGLQIDALEALSYVGQ